MKYGVFILQMEIETQQFLQERAERIRLIHERQERDLEQFDEESARLGFRYAFFFSANHFLSINSTDTNARFNFLVRWR